MFMHSVCILNLGNRCRSTRILITGDKFRQQHCTASAAKVTETMGRWGKKKNKDGKTPKPGVLRPGSYPEIVKENKDFEKYYQMQKIVPEAEWDTFMGALRQTLPATFRVTGSRSQAEALLHLIRSTYLQDLTQGSNDKEVQIFPLPWYPDNLAWQMNIARTDIRKIEAFNKLHNFLMSETDSGNISRQETVSMIPPVVLQVEPHHKVLDMCAAPGSKTAQILEFLHAGETRIPAGVVIANDVENQRCYTLVRQAKRLQSPALLVTNHDATEYPDIFHKKDGELVPIKFDRILCDVPCSGDGTLRKNCTLWKRWQAATALQLHLVQYRIAKRGLELLEIGGHLVYSTCSLNPVENEAVVHHLLRDCAGAVKLLDINLPGLKSSPGVSTWIPVEKNGVPYTTFEAIGNKGASALREYHFPPSETDKGKYPLEKSIRVLPHHQNTGGFFIALFKKTKAIAWEQVALPQDRIALGVPRTKEGQPEKKIRKNLGLKEEPFIFMDDKAMWGPLSDFYKLDPLAEPSRFLIRSAGEKPKNIYFTTDLLKNIVQSNEGYVKIINTGVKTFTRCENNNSPCDYRLASEGLNSVMTFIKSRVVSIPKEDLVILLLNDDQNTPPLTTTLSASTQSAVEHLEKGCFVMVVECTIGTDGPSFSIEVLGWRGNASIRAYVPINERVHYLRMCGADVSKFDKNKFKDTTASEGGEGEDNEGELSLGN